MIIFPNGCNRTIPEALRFLAHNERPEGGESRFNAAHLEQLAQEFEGIHQIAMDSTDYTADECEAMAEMCRRDGKPITAEIWQSNADQKRKETSIKAICEEPEIDVYEVARMEAVQMCDDERRMFEFDDQAEEIRQFMDRASNQD